MPTPPDQDDPFKSVNTGVYFGESPPDPEAARKEAMKQEFLRNVYKPIGGGESSNAAKPTLQSALLDRAKRPGPLMRLSSEEDPSYTLPPHPQFSKLTTDQVLDALAASPQDAMLDPWPPSSQQAVTESSALLGNDRSLADEQGYQTIAPMQDGIVSAAVQNASNDQTAAQGDMSASEQDRLPQGAGNLPHQDIQSDCCFGILRTANSTKAAIIRYLGFGR